jgi:hypothetical protein
VDVEGWKQEGWGVLIRSITTTRRGGGWGERRELVSEGGEVAGGRVREVAFKVINIKTYRNNFHCDRRQNRPFKEQSAGGC